jgi:hypothetical protein
MVNAREVEAMNLIRFMATGSKQAPATARRRIDCNLLAGKSM